jgi:hypothetical protein
MTESPIREILPASPTAAEGMIVVVDDYAEWVRRDVDLLLDDYPDTSVAALAAALERDKDSYDDGPERALEVVAEMRSRVEANVRFWPLPGPNHAVPPPTFAEFDPVEDDEIPW